VIRLRRIVPHRVPAKRDKDKMVRLRRNSRKLLADNLIDRLIRI
jgi:hypothetical protein